MNDSLNKNELTKISKLNIERLEHHLDSRTHSEYANCELRIFMFFFGREECSCRDGYKEQESGKAQSMFVEDVKIFF